MMNHSTTFRLLASALCVAVGAQASELSGAEFSGNVTYASDYLYDGLSQTQNRSAWQAGLNVVTDSGVYVSTWASQVDFGTICGADFNQTCSANVETDWLVGYSGGDEKWAYDIGYAYYKYFSSGDGFDYAEVYASVSVGDSKLALYHSNDFAGTNIKTRRVKLFHTFFINESWSIPLELGHDRFSQTFYFGGAVAKSYNYVRAAAGYSIKDWYAELAYVRSDLDTLTGADADMLSADGNVVFSLTYSFSHSNE